MTQKRRYVSLCFWHIMTYLPEKSASRLANHDRMRELVLSANWHIMTAPVASDVAHHDSILAMGSVLRYLMEDGGGQSMTAILREDTDALAEHDAVFSGTYLLLQQIMTKWCSRGAFHQAAPASVSYSRASLDWHIMTLFDCIYFSVDWHIMSVFSS